MAAFNSFPAAAGTLKIEEKTPATGRAETARLLRALDLATMDLTRSAVTSGVSNGLAAISSGPRSVKA